MVKFSTIQMNFSVYLNYCSHYKKPIQNFSHHLKMVLNFEAQILVGEPENLIPH